MKLERLSEPLRTDQIEFRVQSINGGGYATILAYKDARADMQRLDDVVGPLNWKREHLNANHNCVVSIWNDKAGHWVSKEDTGTASNTEAAKGLASDSFKRACFNWGIGRELYDYPVIQIKLNSNEWETKNGKRRQAWGLQLKEWRWRSVFAGKEIISLAAKDTQGNTRFNWIKNEMAELRATLVGFYQSGDSEGLLVAFDQLQQDEEKMNAVWKLIDSATRSGMKKMIAEERKNNG